MRSLIWKTNYFTVSIISFCFRPVSDSLAHDRVFFSVFNTIIRKCRLIWKLFAVSFAFVPLVFDEIGPSRIHWRLVCGMHCVLWHRFIQLQQWSRSMCSQQMVRPEIHHLNNYTLFLCYLFPTFLYNSFLITDFSLLYHRLKALVGQIVKLLLALKK